MPWLILMDWYCSTDTLHSSRLHITCQGHKSGLRAKSMGGAEGTDADGRKERGTGTIRMENEATMLDILMYS
jgi:hypothetical protein